ncbi:MAG: leucine-rich repeat domain-containing protein, partial [Oscillospiraceae bacterium]|nr:leucine-rich repeat domain-containing protein [Oscillospiraceae bacterium]
MKCQKIMLGIVSFTLVAALLHAPAEMCRSIEVTAVAVDAEEEVNPGISYQNCGDHIEITGYDGRLTDGYGAHLYIPDMIEDLPVTKICSGACKNIPTLYEVWIPASMEEIEEEAFAECQELTRVHFPAKMKSIGKRAFYNCGTLSDMTIPEMLDEIHEEAFAGCRELYDLALPDTLRTIRRGVFSDTGITVVSIPASVERIENDAFSGCESLKTVCYKGSADAWSVLSVGGGNECLYQAELLCNYNKKKVEHPLTF